MGAYFSQTYTLVSSKSQPPRPTGGIVLRPNSCLDIFVSNLPSQSLTLKRATLEINDAQWRLKGAVSGDLDDYFAQI